MSISPAPGASPWCSGCDAIDGETLAATMASWAGAPSEREDRARFLGMDF